MQELVLYEDKELTKPITTLDFGRVPVASKNIRVFYLANNSADWPISDIKLGEQKDNELKITYPQFLGPNESREVLIEWSPSFNRRKPLTLTELFRGDLLIG